MADADSPTAFIAQDTCGWNDSHIRYTHMPSGHTLVSQPDMSRRDWAARKLAFMQKYPGLNIHRCPSRYTTEAPIIGTTDDCVRTMLETD